MTLAHCSSDGTGVLFTDRDSRGLGRGAVISEEEFNRSGRGPVLAGVCSPVNEANDACRFLVLDKNPPSD